MYHVYLIRSLKYPDQVYIGYTINMEQRLETHNSGGSVHTATYRPWELIACLSFKEKSTALAFESYLKSGSGNAFAKKRFWNSIQ
jgi:putative endonuclease